jgi:Flp pilus assembly protein TadG
MRHLYLRLRAFQAESSGAVALMFAVLSLPLIAMVGAAVDYSQAARIREQMQNALDAATLAAAAKATGRTAGQIERTHPARAALC